MKKYFIGLLGALSIATPQTIAYKLDVISNENILHQETVLDGLEKYESQALSRLANTLKDTKIDPDSMVSLALSLDGSIHSLTYKDPGNAIQADSTERKALQNARLLQFGKIPTLKSGYIKMSLPFKELMAGNYKRKLYIVQTPEGQSIGGTGGISISGVDGNISAREIDLTKRRSLPRTATVASTPYTARDRKFDNDIASIYSVLKTQPTSFSPLVDAKTNIKEIEEDSQNYLNRGNFLAAAISYLSEASYFMKMSDLEQVKARFSKAKNLFNRLQLHEKEDFLRKVMLTSQTGRNSSENYSCREFLLVESYTLSKNVNDIDFDLKLDTIQWLADFYMGAGQTNEALNYYKQMLTEALKSRGTANRTARIYTKVATAQITLKDTTAANKTLLEASKFLEKEFGKESVTLIPVFVMMMQNTSDPKEQENRLDRIETIVDNYKQVTTDPRRNRRDDDARIASNILMDYSHQLRYRRNEPNSPPNPIVAAVCAQLGYKLRLKSEPRFDYSTFNQVINSMQDAGQYEQVASLYKATLAMLESSTDRIEKMHEETIRRNYIRELERTNNNSEAEKLKKQIEGKEQKKLAESLNKLEERFSHTSESSRIERIQLEAGLFSAYVKQKSISKTNEILAKLLIDLKAIDGTTKELNSLGFLLVGPIRTQPEFFQENPKMEEMLIKAILLLDEKSENGVDLMVMNTLTLRAFGGEKNELATKVAKAIEEARKGRVRTSEKDKTASLDSQIDAARVNRDYKEMAKLKRTKLDSLIADRRPNYILVSEALNLSKIYSDADQPQEAEKAFREALALIDSAKPADRSRSASALGFANSFQIMRKRYDLAELGLRKYADLIASTDDSDGSHFHRLHDFDSLNRAYIENGDFDKAIEFQRFVLKKFESSHYPNKKLICEQRLSLSNVLLRVASRDSARKEPLTKESEAEFNKAISELTSYYGPKSSQVQRAVSERTRLE